MTIIEKIYNIPIFGLLFAIFQLLFLEAKDKRKRKIDWSAIEKGTPIIVNGKDGCTFLRIRKGLLCTTVIFREEGFPFELEVTVRAVEFKH